MLYETAHVERAVLAQMIPASADAAEAADSLLELGRLADTAGFEVAGQLTQCRNKPDGGTLFGSGKVEELHLLLEETGARIALFDNPLNAIQAHNLARELGVRVMDRTEVILEIFARRARSNEAQTQVELAKTEFLLSRIPELAAQQRFSGTGGGMRVRGPGESHLQLRNMPIRRRIAELRKRLESFKKQAQVQRGKRREWPSVCLCGYTNAGKSTLLNTLTDAGAYSDDRLFATLDTKTRLMHLAPNRNVLLTDTVGFIRNLPHALVASFRSTLEGVAQADLLLVVVDASHPRVGDQIRVCRDTLKAIGAGHVPTLLVFNKCDDPDSAPVVTHAPEEYPQGVPVSAKTGFGLDALKLAVLDELQKTCELWSLPGSVG